MASTQAKVPQEIGIDTDATLQNLRVAVERALKHDATTFEDGRAFYLAVESVALVFQKFTDEQNARQAALATQQRAAQALKAKAPIVPTAETGEAG